jgi:7-cyano-7-deazaguanine reductase
MTSPPDKPVRYPVDTPDIVRTDLLDMIDYQYRTTRDIDIVIRQPEFTSVCPMTGLPDFGTIVIRYRPNKRLVELKSLKYYLLQYRNVGIFYEHVVNRILDDLVTVVAPKRMEIVGEFTARGGITSTISAAFEAGSETDDGLVK